MSWRPWTDDEVEQLEMQYNLTSIASIRIPGRSKIAIYRKLKYQMLQKKSTVEKYRELSEKWPGRNVRWYARMLGVSVRTAQRCRRAVDGGGNINN